MAIWKQCQRGSLHCRTLKNKLLRVFVLKSSFPSTNINIGSIYLQLLLDNIKIQCQISVFHESRLSLQVHLRLEKVFWKHFRSCGRSLVGLMVWETQVALRCATPLSGRLCLFPKLVICWLYFFYSRAMLVFNRPSQVVVSNNFLFSPGKLGGNDPIWRALLFKWVETIRRGCHIWGGRANVMPAMLLYECHRVEVHVWLAPKPLHDIQKLT